MARGLINQPLHEMSRVQRVAVSNLRLVFLVARWEVVDRVKLHAQALTYDTLLALVPLLAVVFAVVKGVGGMQNVNERIEAFVVGNLAGSPEVQEVVAAHIGSFVENTHAGNIGAVSVVILVFSVMSLLGHIEFAFNSIFGQRGTRSLPTKLMVYWAILTLGPVLLAASFALTAALQTSSVAAALETFGKGSRFAVNALPMAASWVALTVMYLTIPAARVRLSAALPAAIVAGTLWSGAKYGYAIYAKNAITLQNIYGSLAAIPLFILWIYVSWLLVLVGAQLTFALQNAATYRPERDTTEVSPSMRERAACRLMLEIARDFYTGRPPTGVENVGDALGIPRHLALDVASLLRAGGFVRETEPDGGFVPAMALEKISVDDILRHARHGNGDQNIISRDAGWQFVDGMFNELAQAQARLIADVDFRRLAARFASPSPAKLAKEDEGASPRPIQKCGTLADDSTDDPSTAANR